MKVTLDNGAKMPTKAHEFDAGWDLYAKDDFDVDACSIIYCVDLSGSRYDEVAAGSAIHDTGVHIAIPEGYAGFIKSKSGLNVKHGLTAEGVVDSGYTGSIVVKLYNHTSKPYHFNKGDKITQLVILPVSTERVELVDSLEDTDRGTGGFGSTGR